SDEVRVTPSLRHAFLAELSPHLPPSRQMPSSSFLGAIRVRGESLFRVWAPQASVVEVVFEESREDPLALKREPDGYFSGATSARVSLYKYRVDGTGPWPDPCSRFQPQGVHGPSMIVDPSAFKWGDAGWRGAKL